MGLEENYTQVLTRVRTACSASGRSPGDVTLIAVSKKHPIEKIAELYHLGQRDFGENYAQELAEKAGSARQMGLIGIRWHMIGHLQRNKVKLIVPYVDAIHSLDSEKLAGEIQARAAQELDVFIEVNVDAEANKAGVTPDEAAAMAPRISKYSQLRLRGLMCIPDPGRDESVKAFRALKELGEKVGAFTQGALSMGMTADFETAIQEGATHIRVGTAIFGERSAPKNET